MGVIIVSFSNQTIGMIINLRVLHGLPKAYKTEHIAYSDR